MTAIPARVHANAVDKGSAMHRKSRHLPLCLSCAFLASLAHAFEPPAVAYPAIADAAATPAGFVPPGWRLEHELRGRLDGDAREDVLLLLRMDAPGNVVDNAGPGPDRFDTNPRMLVAAVAGADGGWRRVMAHHALVPRAESPVMDDVLGDDPAGAIAIRANRTWTIGLHGWASAGSWSAREVGYTFRLEGGCMRLVGYDDMHLHRASGEITTTSVNYLDGRAWTRSGSIADDTPGPRRWMRLASTAPVCIDDIGDGLAFAPALADPAP